MTGDLAAALRDLLTQALPDLLGGTPPAVDLIITPGAYDVDPASGDAVAGEPRADDRTDRLPFDPANADGPYDLTQSPYPGPRIVRLLTAAGDRLALRPEEVVWDAAEPRRFTLAPRPDRDLSLVSEVLVLYSVAAVFTTIKTADVVLIDLQSADDGALAQAEALVFAVLALNRPALADAARASYAGGDYGAVAEVKDISVLTGASPAIDTRRLTLLANCTLKATRTLGADVGQPIRRIVTPGRPLDPDRPVDIQIEVES